MSVACIDAWQNGQGGPAPGGTCTNVGCIPSKALLQSSEHYEQANHHFAEHGIEVKGVSLKLDTLIGRKNSVVKQNNDGILYLFKKNKVTFFHGKGAFAGQVEGGWAIKVTGTTEEDLVAKHVVVATGSSARELPGLPFDEKVVLSNDGALNIGAVPKTLGVIGAGVIGLEMGSVWRRLGSEVTILEAMPEFLAAADGQVAKEALKAFTKQGLNIQMGVKIGEIKATAKSVTVPYVDAKGAEQKLVVDKLIVSIGRVPHRRPERRRRRPEARRARLRRRGRRLQDQPAQRLGGGRRGARPDAGAQGRGRGRGGCRAHRRPARPRQLRHRAVGHLHLAGNRLGRQDRAAAQEGRPRVQGRQLPLPGQRPRPRWATPPASPR